MATASASAMRLGITSIGMVSPLGLDAPTSCAAARAGLIRAAPLDSFKIYSKGAWADVGIVGHALREFAGGFEGLGKLIRLGGGALDDLLRNQPSPEQDWATTGLCVALPSGYFQTEQARDSQAFVEDGTAPQAFRAALTDKLLDRICELCSIAIPADNRSLIFEDQAGFAWGLQYAWQALNSGRFERCIVGGIDACTDGGHLAAAHHFNVVKTEDQPAGFQPGEAAAFLILETAAKAFKSGSRVLAWIDAAAVGQEQVSRCSRKPALGIGLADTIDACLGLLPEPGALGWTIADLNGDAFRGNDWGYALTRLAARDRRIGTFPTTIPAESFGDIGAAHGAVASCMAVRAFARACAPASQALVWLASYDGGRGAFVIRSEA